jgi:hypothetical protein
MVQQRSRQESLADEAQREKNKKNNIKNDLRNRDYIDKLKKYLEKNPPGEIDRLGPYRPPSWFKRINPNMLPDNLEKRYKNLQNYFAKKEKRAISDKDMANAKGGKIKVYAKGGGVRKPNY